MNPPITFEEFTENHWQTKNEASIRPFLLAKELGLTDEEAKDVEQKASRFLETEYELYLQKEAEAGNNTFF